MVNNNFWVATHLTGSLSAQRLLMTKLPFHFNNFTRNKGLAGTCLMLTREIMKINLTVAFAPFHNQSNKRLPYFFRRNTK